MVYIWGIQKAAFHICGIYDNWIVCTQVRITRIYFEFVFNIGIFYVNVKVMTVMSARRMRYVEAALTIKIFHNWCFLHILTLYNTRYSYCPHPRECFFNTNNQGQATIKQNRRTWFGIVFKLRYFKLLHYSVDIGVINGNEKLKQHITGAWTCVYCQGNLWVPLGGWLPTESNVCAMPCIWRSCLPMAVSQNQDSAARTSPYTACLVCASLRCVGLAAHESVCTFWIS